VVHLAVEPSSRWSPVVAYFRTGVEHIWSGYDHLLFLLSLLLPAALLRRQQCWEPQPALRRVLTEVASTVTAFTIAHSLTLTLATIGVLNVPTRAAETLIALSVVLAAMNNVWPVVCSRRWLVAFGFGLVHGLGFASLLTDLGLPSGTRVWALLGFNLGVEAGQLAIVAAFLPVAWYLRDSRIYRRLGMIGGSLAIAAIGVFWLTERAFDLG
jgi:hypothetical protein